MVTQLELRRAVAARDALRAEDAKTFRIREALAASQATVDAVAGDLATVLDAVVQGAMRTAAFEVSR